MRKSLIITLLLLALGLGGIYGAHAGVNIKKDAVLLEEIILYGDKAAAEGLIIDVSTHCNNHLFWDTSYELGSDPQINTKFRFSQKQKFQQHDRSYRGIDFVISESGGFSTSGGIDLDSDSHSLGHYFSGMKELYKDVASRTEAGKTHKEKLYLIDYYDFYPLSVSFDFPGYYWDLNREFNKSEQSSEDEDKTPIQYIKDYFRIPVLDNHRLEVSVSKNDEGLITDINISPVDGSGVNLWTNSLVADNICYFTFNNSTQSGSLLDTSLIPGGYGIYRLPFTKAEEENDTLIFPEKLEMVYALDPQVQIADLRLSEDKSRLLLMTREGKAYYLTVLDVETAHELQKLKLLECDNDVYLWPFYSDLFIVSFISDGRLMVIEDAGKGEYRNAFTVDTPKSSALKMPLTSNLAIAWNGERLALAEAQLEEIDYFRSEKCGFSLSVYGEKGLLYAASYDSSLDANFVPDPNYNYNCSPLNRNPISLHWKGIL